ncbi:MAG: hypothetical protein GY821_02870 [Gammaproteobacteria bacterium]|nr:hypothetical protein [Gammaproteobacteria bacterium]
MSCHRPLHTAPQKLSIQGILLDNNHWWTFFQENQPTIRSSVMDNIVKVMSCQRRCNGFAIYRCSNKDCHHAKVVPFTCGGRFCNRCGHKSTQIWIAKQTDTLPETTWQHITFTLPDVFWNLFWENRWMLNAIARIAAEVIQSIALERGIKVGIFTALHTFGRDLKRYPLQINLQSQFFMPMIFRKYKKNR